MATRTRRSAFAPSPEIVYGGHHGEILNALNKNGNKITESIARLNNGDAITNIAREYLNEAERSQTSFVNNVSFDSVDADVLTNTNMTVISTSVNDNDANVSNTTVTNGIAPND